MTQGLTWKHAAKVVLILLFLMGISVMISAAPEQYIYGGF